MEIVKLLNDNEDRNETIKKFKDVMDKNGINTYMEKYDDSLPMCDLRLMLKTPHTTNSKYKYVKDANGVIISLDTLKIVTRMPSTFITPPSRNNLDISINKGEYKIYEINEGTILTLYYWNRDTSNYKYDENEKNGEWCLSSKHGYNINNMKWHSNKTFMELINECMDKLDLKLDLDTLDKNHSYVFGFRHPDHHPLNESENYKLWFINSFDRINQKFDNKNELKFPLMRIIEEVDLKNNENRSREHNYYKDIMLKNLDKSIDNYIKDKKPFYGYILEDKYNNRILLESKLLVDIKKYFYNHDNLELIGDKIIHIYWAMYEYIKFKDQGRFLKIFNQYQYLYPILDKFFTNLFNNVKNNINNIDKINNFGDETYNNIIKHVTITYRTHVNNNNDNYIYPIVYSTKNIDMYYEYLINGPLKK